MAVVATLQWMPTPPMLPSASPYDILRAARWRSALLTTFSLSLGFFEAVPLHALRNAGTLDVSILADLAGYQASLAEAGATDVGRTYDLIPLKIPGGCFHPKIMMLDGADGLRATVGSGNLTFGGWGHNVETLDLLVPAQAPLAFADLADFLGYLALYIEEGRFMAPRCPTMVGAMEEACRRAARVGGTGRTRVLHTFDGPIAGQLAMHAEDLGGAEELTVLSPYFGGPDAVLALGEALDCARIQVAVTGRAPEFYDFAGAGSHVEPVRSDAFSSTSLLHAKIFEVVCRHGRLTLAGSANATGPALIRSGNVEASVLRVVDDRLTFGWVPTGVPDTAAGEGGDPDPAGGPCLAALFDEGVIQGRVFGTFGSAGAWDARVVSGTVHAALPAIVVGPDGSFASRPGAALPIRDLLRSTQLVLMRDGVEVRGWLAFDHVLAAVRERGPVAVAILRTLAGYEEPEDLAVILSFFVSDPTAFLGDDLGAPSRGGEGHEARDDPGATVDPAALQPNGAFGDRIAFGAHGAGASAFERLLVSLRRYVRDAAPPSRALADADDIGDTAQGDIEESGALPRWRVEALVDAVADFVDALPRDGSEFRRHAGSLLELILFAAERSSEPEALRAEHIQRWMGIVRGAGAAVEGPDPLDLAYVAVLVSRVLADAAWAGRAHERLQAWCRGPLDPTWIGAAAPVGGEIRERRLSGSADGCAWDEAVRLTLIARTTWTTVQEVQRALVGGDPIPDLPGALSAEAAVLARATAVPGGPRRVYALPAPSRWPACQRCFRNLPAAGRERLRTHRIALVQCCDVVLLDPWLD